MLSLIPAAPGEGCPLKLPPPTSLRCLCYNFNLPSHQVLGVTICKVRNIYKRYGQVLLVCSYPYHDVILNPRICKRLQVIFRVVIVDALPLYT